MEENWQTLRDELLTRVRFYQQGFPKHPPMNLVGNRLEGVWIIGNSYGGSKYYGSYPGNYLRRVISLFPDALTVLHLFSGSLPQNNEYTRFDIQGSPDVMGDAHDLSKCFPNKYFNATNFDLIIADPPYSKADAEKYGYPMINRRKVLGECWKVLSPGGWLLWLDEVCPIYAKKNWNWGMFFPIFTSTNRRLRALFGFQKKD